MIRFRPVALALLAATGVLACDDDPAVPAEEVGVYELTQVNGQPPPVMHRVSPYSGDSVFLGPASLELKPGNVYRYRELRWYGRGDGSGRDTVRYDIEGSYRREGPTVWVNWEMPYGAGADSMDYYGSHIEDWWGSAYLILTRRDAQ